MNNIFEFVFIFFDCCFFCCRIYMNKVFSFFYSIRTYKIFNIITFDFFIKFFPRKPLEPEIKIVIFI